MKRNIKVSIICHNLAENSVGRSYIIAKALQRYYDTEILGLSSDGSIWGPISQDKSIKFKIVKTRNPYKFSKEINGDIILVCKPKGNSFGYGLFVKKLKKMKLILDIDDWDIAFFHDLPIHGKLHDILRFWDFDSAFYTWVLEKFISKADGIIVSNTFLQSRFGGDIIPHFRDTQLFNPSKYDRKKIKMELGLSNKKIILFLGTPRRHKGIMDLILAVEKLNRDDVVLMIVGLKDSERNNLPKKTFLKIMGQQPFDVIPRFLAAADVVVIFQKKSKSSQGQLPAKVFDAMSMAKPIIASNISDLPKILNGCGIIIEPGNVVELAAAIDNLLNDYKLARKLGIRAREKCIEGYSYDAIAPQLRNIIESYLAKDSTTAEK